MQVEIRKTSRLDEGDVAAMERLYRETYEGAPDETFRRDLARKDRAIILREGGVLRGFSTMKLLSVAGMRVLFSGDTVVAPDCRRRAGLAGGFGHVMRRLAEDGGDLAYWFLICKGARTYRFLPTFFRMFVPGAVADAGLSARLAVIAAALYPAEYDPACGILRFGEGKDRLRADALRTDEESVRFRELNPHWTRGDELCCLAPLALENLKPAGLRVIAAVTPTWDE